MDRTGKPHEPHGHPGVGRAGVRAAGRLVGPVELRRTRGTLGGAVSDAPGLRLVGVAGPVRPSAQGVALLSVGGQPARAYKPGDAVDATRVVLEVTAHTVKIGPAGGASSVTLEAPPAASRHCHRPPLTQEQAVDRVGGLVHPGVVQVLQKPLELGFLAGWNLQAHQHAAVVGTLVAVVEQADVPGRVH